MEATPMSNQDAQRLAKAIFGDKPCVKCNGGGYTVLENDLGFCTCKECDGSGLYIGEKVPS
jgi:DnaJ-class molecular chaperone